MIPPRFLRLTSLGWGAVVPALFLCLLGLVTIHSTERTGPEDSSESRTAAGPFDRSSHPTGAHPAAGFSEAVAQVRAAIGEATLRQAAYMLTGVLLMFGILVAGYQRIGRYSYLLYWSVVGLLFLLVLDRVVDVPFVPVKRATRRWIEIGGFGIQPSELMKVAFIMALARYLRFRSNYRQWRGLIAPFLWTLLPMVLIHFQPDLGTLLMLLPVLFAMLFVAGARLRHLATIVLLGAATLPAFYLYGMAEYQKQRIEVLFKQNVPDENWHMGDGYQLRQSKIALGTGGLTGEGFGRGIFVESEKALLPEEHNDFIFAMIGHQWGWIGCMLTLAAYGVIVLVGIEVATVTNDPFGRLLAIGVVVMIVAQALLNIGMTTGLAPITGMTLPFVSAGGSSLWANFIALGLLINVAQRRPMLITNPPFEHGE